MKPSKQQTSKMLTLSAILTTLILTGCGGGGGGSSSGGGSVVSGDDVIERLYSFSKSNNGNYHTAGLTNTNGSMSYYNGTSELSGPNSIEQMRNAVTEEGENYACGRDPSLPNVNQCFYLAPDNIASRDEMVRGADSQNEIEIKAINGLSNVIVDLVGAEYQWEIEAANRTNSTEYPDVTFNPNDIAKNWYVKGVSMQTTDYPTTDVTGSLNCTATECSGAIIIQNMAYNDSNDYWYGDLQSQGAAYRFYGKISPNKEILTILACGAGTHPQDFINQCLFISGSQASF